MTMITGGENLIRRLEEAGFEAYYVGGCVRDFLMGREGGDVDITTSATPDEIMEVFRGDRVIETGLKHGTVTVLDDHVPFEITTFRTDGTYSDNRHPDSVIFVRNLEEDLLRRDFTMNAIAMRRSGDILDPFGGVKDIDRKVIRAVGDPDRRFQEDALRIMRAMRFASVLGFEIEEQTAQAMFRNKELLRNVSAERIFVEFKKLIVGQHDGDVIRKYIDIIGVVIPQMLPMKDFNQRNPYHKYDILEHCIRAMEVIEFDSPESAEYMKMAALFHDIGKPETFFVGDDGIGHMYGHPDKGEVIVREIMGNMKADRFTTDKVAALVKNHDLVFQNDEKLLKRWMNRYGAELLLEILHIKRADNIATGNMSHELEDKFDQVEETIRRLIDTKACVSLGDLAVNGMDVMAAARAKAPEIKEGPWVGQLLDKVLEEVIDGKLANDRSELLKRIDSLVVSK